MYIRIGHYKECIVSVLSYWSGSNMNHLRHWDLASVASCKAAKARWRSLRIERWRCRWFHSEGRTLTGRGEWLSKGASHVISCFVNAFEASGCCKAQVLKMGDEIASWQSQWKLASLCHWFTFVASGLPLDSCKLNREALCLPVPVACWLWTCLKAHAGTWGD